MFHKPYLMRIVLSKDLPCAGTRMHFVASSFVFTARFIPFARGLAICLIAIVASLISGNDILERSNHHRYHIFWNVKVKRRVHMFCFSFSLVKYFHPQVASEENDAHLKLFYKTTTFIHRMHGRALDTCYY